MKLHSINSAALELGKDRATLSKALRDVPPDGDDKGQPRWTISTIVRAIGERIALTGRTGGAPSLANISPEVKRLCAEFDKKLRELNQLDDIDQRREFALAHLAPLMDLVSERCSEWSRLVFPHGEYTPANAAGDAMFADQMRRTIAACDWHDGGWEKISEAMPGNAEAETMIEAPPDIQPVQLAPDDPLYRLTINFDHLQGDDNQ